MTVTQSYRTLWIDTLLQDGRQMRLHQVFNNRLSFLSVFGHNHQKSRKKKTVSPYLPMRPVFSFPIPIPELEYGPIQNTDTVSSVVTTDTTVEEFS